MGKRPDRFAGRQAEASGQVLAGAQEELSDLAERGLSAGADPQGAVRESAGGTVGDWGACTAGAGRGWGRKTRALFLISTVVLLLCTGLGKLAGMALAPRLGGPVADPPDAVLPFLRTSHLAVLAAGLELACAGLVWRWRHHDRAFVVLVYWVGLLLAYRLAAWSLGTEATKGCRCLGAPGRWLRLSRSGESWAATGILAYWVLGLGVWACAKLKRVPGWGRGVKLGVGLLACSVGPALGEHLELHGIQAVFRYLENGQLQEEPELLPFTVWLSTDRWCVQQGAEWAFGDGRNTFAGLLGNPVGGALAYSGFMPLFSTYRVMVPWLALCSGPFFRHEPQWRHLPIPTELALTEPEAHICEAEVVFLDEAQRLPRSVVFRTTESRLKNAGRSPYLRFERLELHGRREQIIRWLDYTWEYPTGFVRSHYQVLTSTNVYGIELPLKSQLLSYGRRGVDSLLSGERRTNRPPRPKRPPGRAWQPFLAARYALEISNIVERTGEVPLSLLPEHADVVDHRLQSRRWGVEYVLDRVRDGQWKLAPDATLTNMFREKVAEFRRERLRQYSKRVPVVLAFGALLLLPPAVVVWRMIKRKKPQANGGIA